MKVYALNIDGTVRALTQTVDLPDGATTVAVMHAASVLDSPFLTLLDRVTGKASVHALSGGHVAVMPKTTSQFTPGFSVADFVRTSDAFFTKEFFVMNQSGACHVPMASTSLPGVPSPGFVLPSGANDCLPQFDGMRCSQLAAAPPPNYLRECA